MPVSDRPVTHRMPDDVLKALKLAGARQRRTRSAQILHYVEEGLRADGFLARHDERPEGK